MPDAPVYQRSALPPGQTGLVKPPYELADQSGFVRFGQAVENVAGSFLDKIIRAKALNEKHDFIGFVETAQSNYQKELNDNPGMSIEQMIAKQNEMMETIRQSGQHATTGLGRSWIRNWYAANETLIKSRAEANMEAIVSKREMDALNAHIQAAILQGDIGRVQDLYNGVAGTLISREVAQANMELDSLRANKVRQKMVAQQQALNQQALYIQASKDIDGMTVEQANDYIDSYTGILEREQRNDLKSQKENAERLKKLQGEKANDQFQHDFYEKLDNADLVQLQAMIPEARKNDNLSVPDQNALVDAVNKRVKAINEGVDLRGDPFTIGRLRRRARDVGRGVETYEKFESDLQKSYIAGDLGRGKSAFSEYEDVLNIAQTKFEGWQDAAVNASEGTAYRVLQVGESENMWEELVLRSQRGETIDDKEMARIARLRVLRAYTYDRWNQAMTQWMMNEDHKNATSNEIRQAGMSLALDWSKRSLEDIEILMGSPNDYVAIAQSVFNKEPKAKVAIETPGEDRTREIAAKRDVSQLGKPSKVGPMRNPKFSKKDGDWEYRYDLNGKEIGVVLENDSVLKVGNEFILNGARYKYLGGGQVEKL